MTVNTISMNDCSVHRITVPVYTQQSIQ